VERLILLFNTFEGINGCRGEIYNRTLMDMLTSLTKEDVERLYAKYKIDPIGNTPWKKGFTGGSDDHAGMLLGKTHTFSEASFDINSFMDDIKTVKLSLLAVQLIFIHLPLISNKLHMISHQRIKQLILQVVWPENWYQIFLKIRSLLYGKSLSSIISEEKAVYIC